MKIKYWFIILIVLLIFLGFFIKFENSCKCFLYISDDYPLVIVDKKTYKYIEENDIFKVEINFDNYKNEYFVEYYNSYNDYVAYQINTYHIYGITHSTICNIILDNVNFYDFLLINLFK